MTMKREKAGEEELGSGSDRLPPGKSYFRPAPICDAAL